MAYDDTSQTAWRTLANTLEILTTCCFTAPNVVIKAHSHRARLRPLTDVDALGVNAQAFSHVFHMGVDALGVNGPLLSTARAVMRNMTS